MASTTTSKFDPERFAELLDGLSEAETNAKLQQLSNTRRKAVSKILLEKKKPEIIREGEEAEESGDEANFNWESLQTQGGAAVKPDLKEIKVDRNEIDAMWASIDGSDMDNIDADALLDFDYQGFDAETLLVQLMTHGKRAGLTTKEIMKDITTLAGLAHKKGSVSDKNYPKMKKSGQARYDALASRYHIVKGSGKGKSPEVITVSRIGPAFPGRITRMIQAGKLQPRRFIGPFKSSTASDDLQSQAFPTAIPSTMEELARDYCIGLCIAYSCDQSINIADKDKKKPTPEEAIKDQTNFIHLSNGSLHPDLNMRRDMIKAVNWNNFYDKSLACAQAYKKYQTDFEIPDRSAFLASIAKLKL